MTPPPVATPVTGRLVLPDRETPPILGLLNIIFGSLLLAWALFAGGWAVAGYFLAPTIAGVVENFERMAQRPRQREIEAIERLEKAAAAAATPEEREKLDAEIQERRGRLSPVGPKITVAMAKIQQNVWLSLVVPICKYSIGALLNVVMIVSGIGLRNLKESSRKVTLWMSGGKVLRILLVLVVDLAFVLPVQMEMQKDIQKSMREQMAQSSRGGPNAQQQKTIMETMAVAQTVAGFAAIVVIALGSTVYPLLLCWFLTRPRVKLAFAKQPDEGGTLVSPNPA